MKTIKLSILPIFVFMMVLITKSGFSQLPSSDPAYKLSYSDEFAGDTVSEHNWKRSYPWHQGTNISYFGSQSVPMAAIKTENISNINSYVSDGSLKLVSRKVENLNEVWNWYDYYCGSVICDSCIGKDPIIKPSGDTICFDKDMLPFHFSSGMLYSKHEFRYGYFELRFRTPNSFSNKENYKGHGFGFWLWSGGDGITNDWSEIDFPEVNAYCADCSTIQHCGGSNIHYRPVGQAKEIEPSPYYNFEPNTWYTIGINWTSNTVEFFIDGSLFFVAYNHAADLSPMNSIINLGGQYQPLDNYQIPYDTTSTIKTQFPFTFEVDYLRVYQHKYDLSCDSDTTLSSFNASSYGNRLHRTISMGTNTNITNTSFQSFWASDYVLLNEGTYIDNNSTVLINTNDCNNITFTKMRDDEPIPPPQSFIDKQNQ
jgi:hypothetical protein